MNGDRKIFLIICACCHLFGASASRITDVAGVRLMRSECWRGVGFQIWAICRPLITQWPNFKNAISLEVSIEIAF